MNLRVINPCWHSIGWLPNQCMMQLKKLMSMRDLRGNKHYHHDLSFIQLLTHPIVRCLSSSLDGVMDGLIVSGA